MMGGSGRVMSMLGVPARSIAQRSCSSGTAHPGTAIAAACKFLSPFHTPSRHSSFGSRSRSTEEHIRMLIRKEAQTRWRPKIKKGQDVPFESTKAYSKQPGSCAASYETDSDKSSWIYLGECQPPLVKSHHQPTYRDQAGYDPATPHMFAIIHAKNRQYKVTKSDVMTMDHMPDVNIGDDIIFRNALMVGTPHNTVLGRPLVPGVEVHCHVTEHTVMKDQIIFKKKRRKGYKKFRLHRQIITVLYVTDIKYSGFDGLPGEPALLTEDEAKAKAAAAAAAVISQPKPTYRLAN